LCYDKKNEHEGKKEQRYMSKIAAYLQEHILGEVTVNPTLLEAMSHDMSVLKMTPEMVVYPRVTNDIRKIARFAWQLAEKGHVVPLTARGGGTDETGGAIGKGIILVFPAHMDRIMEFDSKQKLLRVQPGATAQAVNNALALQGMAIPALPPSAAYSTLGGAVIKNTSGLLSGKYGAMKEWVSQLEVVLATGDLLQTGRISKRELGKRKGLQTFEGEIYRAIDNLIEDNKQLIQEKIATDVRNNAGYAGIAEVKQKDGSFDLTPLFAGSQGTLGIVSEMIMKTEFTSASTAVAAIAFNSHETARDTLDKIRDLEPAFLEYYDGTLFTLAAARGRTYSFAKGIEGKISAALLVGFDDFNERTRLRKLKKLHKLLKNTECHIESADGDESVPLLAVQGVTAFAIAPEGKDISAPPVLDGAYVPPERFEEFIGAAAALAAKYQVVLPVHGRMLSGLVYARPILSLHKVGDKQKVFKLLEEYGTLVAEYGGDLIGDGAEGRLKASVAYKELDPEVAALFAAIKAVFDPYGILNPGVKQAVETRHLVSLLRSNYDMAAFATHVPYN
jgi:FAD/FMN-containing dehydrogenase